MTASVVRQRLLSMGASTRLMVGGFRCLLALTRAPQSDAWFDNHFAQIVWKLACVERAFPGALANRWLTADRTLEQLCFRYETELNKARLPILRRIFEGDEPPSTSMILWSVARRAVVRQPANQPRFPPALSALWKFCRASR